MSIEDSPVQKIKRKRKTKGRGKGNAKGQGKGKVSIGRRSKKSTADSSIAQPRGSTKDYPRFNMDESRFLSALFAHALGRFGLAMASQPATEMTVDVFKYLYFAAS